jgi:hypothetical protein
MYPNAPSASTDSLIQYIVVLAVYNLSNGTIIRKSCFSSDVAVPCYTLENHNANFRKKSVLPQHYNLKPMSMVLCSGSSWRKRPYAFLLIE